MAKVYIIILNWNGMRDTLECLESVYNLEYSDFSAIVVDNGSLDDSVNMISRKFPRVILIKNSKNLGYTGGNNVGMRLAMRLGADYVWLLNNDTVVEPDSLTKLVEEAEKFPELGLISPMISYFENPEKVQYIGAVADFITHSVVSVKDTKELSTDRIRQNLMLYGTAMLIGKKVIEAIGYLPERYFAYQEDFDYSLRALRKGFQTRVRLDARVLHKDSQTAGKGSPLHVFLMTRNAYFLWMDNEKGVRKISVPGHFIGKIIPYAKYLSDESDESSLDACLNGIWAAFRGRGGAYDPTFATPIWFKTVFNFFISWHPYFWIRLFNGNIRELVRETLARAQSL